MMSCHVGSNQKSHVPPQRQNDGDTVPACRGARGSGAGQAPGAGVGEPSRLPSPGPFWVRAPQGFNSALLSVCFGGQVPHPRINCGRGATSAARRSAGRPDLCTPGACLKGRRPPRLSEQASQTAGGEARPTPVLSSAGSFPRRRERLPGSQQP